MVKKVQVASASSSCGHCLKQNQNVCCGVRQAEITSSCQIRCPTKAKIAIQNPVLMQSQGNRRKYPRVSVSFLVHCKQEDGSNVGGKAFNLSTGGIAIKTNCPVSLGEQLTVEFVEPETLNVHKVKGEVIWHQFHGDSSVQAEALFTAGIKFLNLNDSV